MKSLIAIALIYSYIANKERIIPDYTIMTFIDEVKKNFNKLQSKIELSDEQFNRLWDKFPFSIETIDRDTGKVRNLDDYKDEELKKLFSNSWSSVKYRLKSLDYIFLNWYSYLPADLICATVQSNALKHLDIDPLKLPIKTNETRRSGEITIYGLEKNGARDRAIACLESYGYKNVDVGGGMICQPGDKAFEFYFHGLYDMSEVDYHDKLFYEPIEILRTILDLENYKSEVLSKCDDEGLLPLDNIFLGSTSLLDKDNNVASEENRALIKLTGDEDAFYSRISGPSDVSVFIDLLGDEVMSLRTQGKLQNKKYERVVNNITLLSSLMESSSSSLEEIDKFVKESNKKPPMKELK